MVMGSKAQRKVAKAEKARDSIVAWRTTNGETLALDVMETTHIWNAMALVKKRIEKATGSKLHSERCRVLDQEHLLREFKNELNRRHESHVPDERLAIANQKFRDEKRLAFDNAWHLIKQGHLFVGRQVRGMNNVDDNTYAAWLTFRGGGSYEQFLPHRKRKRIR